MCCNSHGVIPRSNLHVPLFPTNPPTISLRQFFPKFPSNYQVLRTRFESCRRHFPPKFPPNYQVLRTRFESFRPKSNVNDVVSYTDMDKSFYDLLGIPETGSLLEIKQAYKQLARKYHPDVSPPDRVEEYTQRFIRVQEAYETLSDPGMRAMYDRDMAKGIHFAFSARRRYQTDESMEEKGEWKNRWQSQLSELKRRSMHKQSGNSMSWGARMRKQRNDASS